MIPEPKSRWRLRLDKELVFRPEFEDLDENEWRNLLKGRRVTSSNYDTVLSLDWPHFCANATLACGGPNGWCYTFQGNQAGKLHNRHAAMVDVLARNFPDIFGEHVAAEVQTMVDEGKIPYPNLRYSGSGEVVEAYLPALRQLQSRGVLLWGFTRNLQLAQELRKLGASVIISCDKTSPPGFVEKAKELMFRLAYSSNGVNDLPPVGTLVTFPVHRVGRVREVVDSPSVCPKVLADFLDDCRPKASCQLICQRCHRPH
jgi:hypothetical protein